MGVDRLPSGSCRTRLMVDGQTYTTTLPTEAEARVVGRDPWSGGRRTGRTDPHGGGLRPSVAR